MREIKFRAWINGEMLSPSRTETEMAIRGWIQQESYILMQYTGLKDKNGREIYEGDIVTKAHYVVKWECAGFTPFSIPGLGGYEWENLIAADCEVFGNIYDNPELVKEG